jgi:hypothetical protein
MKKRSGMTVYARLLASFRGRQLTVMEAAKAAGIHYNTAHVLLPQLQRAGLLRIYGETWPARAVVLGLADGMPDVPLVHAKPLKWPGWNANLIAFLSIWRAIQTPRTVPELVEETGLMHKTVSAALNELHGRGMAHIAGHTRKPGAGGAMVRQWRAWPGRDASLRGCSESRRYIHMPMPQAARASVEVRE